MPFVLKLDRNGMLELIAKTIMRKKDFKTPNKKLTVERYVPKKLYERVTLPPPNKDLTYELKRLKSIISRRTKEDELSVKNHDSDPGFAIKQYCRENDLIYPAEEVKQILKDIDETITYYKKHYNVSRPHEVDSSIITLPSKTNKTRAYPSGHACQSRFIGRYLSEKYPQHREGILKAADEGALGRVKAGFHYMMDYDAGILLADKMYTLLNRGLSEATNKIKKKRLTEVISHDKKNVELVQRQSSTKNFLGRINAHRNISNSIASPINRYVCRNSRNTVGYMDNN